MDFTVFKRNTCPVSIPLKGSAYLFHIPQVATVITIKAAENDSSANHVFVASQTGMSFPLFLTQNTLREVACGLVNDYTTKRCISNTDFTYSLLTISI